MLGLEKEIALMVPNVDRDNDGIGDTCRLDLACGIHRCHEAVRRRCRGCHAVPREEFELVSVNRVHDLYPSPALERGEGKYRTRRHVSIELHAGSAHVSLSRTRTLWLKLVPYGEYAVRVMVRPVTTPR